MYSANIPATCMSVCTLLTCCFHRPATLVWGHILTCSICGLTTLMWTWTLECYFHRQATMTLGQKLAYHASSLLCWCGVFTESCSVHKLATLNWMYTDIVCPQARWHGAVHWHSVFLDQLHSCVGTPWNVRRRCSALKWGHSLICSAHKPATCKLWCLLVCSVYIHTTCWGIHWRVISRPAALMWDNTLTSTDPLRWYAAVL
jgi:hypothetical protein